MSYSPSASTIVTNVAAYANNAAQYKYNSKVFVSTFSGETVSLGADNANDGWQNVKNTLSGQGISIYFVCTHVIIPKKSTPSLEYSHLIHFL